MRFNFCVERLVEDPAGRECAGCAGDPASAEAHVRADGSRWPIGYSGELASIDMRGSLEPAAQEIQPDELNDLAVGHREAQHPQPDTD